MKSCGKRRTHGGWGERGGFEACLHNTQGLENAILAGYFGMIFCVETLESYGCTHHRPCILII